MAGENILRFLQKHLVGLGVLASTASGEQHATVVSGFVIEVLGVWHFVTAGHIGNDLLELMKTATGLSTWLMDGWGPTPQSRVASIPIHLTENMIVSAYDPVTEEDIATILLHPQHKRLLEAAGIEAVPEGTWRALSDLPTLTEFALVGIPSKLVRPHMDHSGRIDGAGLSLVCIQVFPTEPPEDMRFHNRVERPPRFYGRYSDPLCDATGRTLDDFDGLSGGPIFGFRSEPDGTSRYFLVAVQSGRRKDLSIVTGTFVEPIGLALSEVIVRFRDETLKTATQIAGAATSV